MFFQKHGKSHASTASQILEVRSNDYALRGRRCSTLIASPRAISWLILSQTWPQGIEVASAAQVGRENLTALFLFTDTSGFLEQAAKALAGELALKAMDVTMGDQQSGGDERRFELVTGNFSWIQAKSDAENRGGKARLHQERRGPIISRGHHAGSSYWIGGTDEVTEGQWKWVDGEAMSFENWAAGEPNDVNWWRECPSNLPKRKME